jgi:hypothetical protein
MLSKEWIVYLEQQTKTDYAFPDVDKQELVKLLFEHIGDTNSHIRDDLVYPNLAHLLYDNHFTESELASYLHQLMGEEYLFFDLDNYIEYSSLIRSFSVLQLVILVGVHNRDNIIASRSIKSLYTRFIEYFQQEQILTGYDETVGFIHTIAHSADLFTQLMKVKSFGEMEIKTMMNAMTNKLKTSKYQFVHDEDERMVRAIRAGLDRQVLEPAFVKRWLESFSTYKKPDTFPKRYYINHNVKQTLRSLYFNLLSEDQYDYICETIKTLLKKNVTL